jgi:hypothetical protein
MEWWYGGKDTATRSMVKLMAVCTPPRCIHFTSGS